MRKVLAVVGPICSGKTTYMNRYPDSWIKVDIGDIVRTLKKEEVRIHDKDLDVAIIARLRGLLAIEGDDCIIVGIRQQSIAVELESYCRYDSNDDFMWIYLDVDQEILEERYVQRSADKDLSITFNEAIKRDVELGYNEMITWVLSRPNKCIIKNNVKNIPLQKS